MTSVVTEVVKQGLLAAGHYRRALARETFPGVAVLCYHGVRGETSARTRFPFDYLHTPADVFESHCRLIRECCDPITLDDWQAAADGSTPLPKRPVLLTFDDGYRTVLTEAAPVLATYQLPAVVFVCTSPMTSTRVLWFDDVAAREGEESVEAWKSRDYDAWKTACASTSPLTSDDPRALMIPAELAALACMDGIEIGGHTARHPILARASADQQRLEIEENLASIESWTGRKVRAFAYPNGRPGIDYTRETGNILRAAGVEFAFTTRSAFSPTYEPALERSRFLVLDDLTEAELAHRLTYSWRR
jgi:peptidoglycan/xylan/chitin deacetylase (PgdA/CDA1 family)